MVSNYFDTTSGNNIITNEQIRDVWARNTDALDMIKDAAQIGFEKGKTEQARKNSAELNAVLNIVEAQIEKETEMEHRKCFEYTVTYTCKGLVYGETEKEALGNIWSNKDRILKETDDPIVLLDEHYGSVDENEYLPIGG